MKDIICKINDIEFRLAVDIVIIENQSILLVKRRIKPFVGCWVLPGETVKIGETLEDAVKRGAKEELGVDIRVLRVLNAYSSLNRDPRGRTIAVAYLCKRGKGEIKLDYEASEVRFFDFKSLPKNIGFDHKKVIEDAFAFINRNQ